jgi:diguanylate cyclase (GGDEF)-like protein
MGPAAETKRLISIKKFLDRDAAGSPGETELDELLAVTIDAYRAALRTIGENAVQACPAPGQALEQGLAKLEVRLSEEVNPKIVKQTQEKVEDQLNKWGRLTAEHLKGKADEVRELLMMLARTAESVGERDQRYSRQFGGLTAELKAIANLDDLTHIRSSLVRKAAEMKSCVDQMEQDGQNSLAQLRSKVSVYESKLKVVEQLASKDTLTGLSNRRSVETRMESLIALGRTYCVVMLDLDLFKAVNDKYGHVAGDDLLKQFSGELQKNVRTEDMVGRWGGDEFIVVLSRDLAGAKSQIQRIRDWVFGDYNIQTGTGKNAQKVQVVASVGVAEGLPGKTVQQVVEEADAAMYLDKRESQKKKKQP